MTDAASTRPYPGPIIPAAITASTTRRLPASQLSFMRCPDERANSNQQIYKNDHGGVYRMNFNAMELNKDREEDSLAVPIATFSSLICLFFVFLATRPVIRILPAHWSEWLFALLFTLVPIAFTFIILFYSAWHLEWSGPKRILLSVLAACLIYGFDLFLLALVAALGAFCPRFVSGH
jgi:hypothetical protein